MTSFGPKLVWVAAIAAVAIAAIWFTRRGVIKPPTIKVTRQHEKVVLDPIQSALIFHEMSDVAFEEIVKRSSEPGTNLLNSDVTFSTSTLIDCASLRRTNYARILIKHGASIDDAVAWHTKYPNQGAVQMLLQLRAELATNSPGSTRQQR